MTEDRTEHAWSPARELTRCGVGPVRRILVVDDDPYICHLSADVLIRHGFEVNAAEDGAAGWKELQTCNYQLLITEYDLRKLTGIALVRKLRAAGMALPVVMAAGRLPTRALARNSALQLAATLVKPFALDALLNTVRTVLRAADRPSEQTHQVPNRPRPPAGAMEALRRYPGHPCWGINE